MLKLDQVSKRFGQTVALDGVSLKVPNSVKTLVLIGPSGGGKSTLLRVVAGLENPDSGEVRFDDEPLAFENELLIAHRRKNGFVFQSWNLFPHLTAVENVALPLEKVHGMDSAQSVARAEEQLRRFQLGDHLTKRPNQLSGGQQQRVALARAIAPKPEWLFLDEPTSALDPEMTAEVLELIEELCKEGQRLILSTHEMGFARAVADEVAFLARGQVLANASPEEIFESAPHPEVKRFIAKVMRY